MMTKLNNSNELLELIKLSATENYNWRGDEKLVVRLSFGVKREEDTLLTMSDVNKYGAMTETDLLCSQEEKDEPRELHVSRKHSKLTKDKPKEVDIFMSKLYANDNNPLHYGYTNEMMEVMKGVILFDSEMYNKLIHEEFPPDPSILTKLLKVTKHARQFKSDGLKPTLDYFNPINRNDIKPPTLKQWKTSTSNGKDWCMNNRYRCSDGTSLANNDGRYLDVLNGKLVSSDTNSGTKSLYGGWD